MFKDDAGKTEKPTAGRLAEASNKGNVPLSREFTMAGTLLIAVFDGEHLGSPAETTQALVSMVLDGVRRR